MSGVNRLLGATTIAGLALSVGLYIDNRSLRGELLAQHPQTAGSGSAIAARAIEPAGPPRAQLPAVHQSGRAPELPTAPPAESRMDRRAARTNEFAQMFGRLDGESEEDYKARVLPLIAAGLIAPRMRLDEQRKVAEDKAHVTPQQSAQLDKAFDKVYGDVLDYTNRAVADGQLSPYERNVAGWLEYAGGLGGILNDANAQIGKVLDPSQMKTMSDAGFEWGEYLGVKAPWEQLKPPPQRSH